MTAVTLQSVGGTQALPFAGHRNAIYFQNAKLKSRSALRVSVLTDIYMSVDDAHPWPYVAICFIHVFFGLIGACYTTTCTSMATRPECVGELVKVTSRMTRPARRAFLSNVIELTTGDGQDGGIALKTSDLKQESDEVVQAHLDGGIIMEANVYIFRYSVAPRT